MTDNAIKGIVLAAKLAATYSPPYSDAATSRAVQRNRTLCEMHAFASGCRVGSDGARSAEAHLSDAFSLLVGGA